MFGRLSTLVAVLTMLMPPKPAKVRGAGGTFAKPPQSGLAGPAPGEEAHKGKLKTSTCDYCCKGPKFLTRGGVSVSGVAHSGWALPSCPPLHALSPTSPPAHCHRHLSPTPLLPAASSLSRQPSLLPAA